MGKTITLNKAQTILGISPTTVLNYMNIGLLKVVKNGHASEQTLFDYDHLCKLLGIEHLPNEPFIQTAEAIKILELPDSVANGGIRDYCKRHKIPYYSFTNGKGSKTYFLRSELEYYMAYQAKWGTEFVDYIIKNGWLKALLSLMIELAKGKFTEKEEVIISSVILQNKPLKKVADSLNISYGSAAEALNRAFKRLNFELRAIQFNRTQMMDLARQNTRLIIQNKILTEKLEAITNNQTPIAEENIDTLSKSFDTCNLSVRVVGILKALEVKNLYELSTFTRSQVEKYRNVGKKTVDALEMLLIENGLDWKKESLLPKRKLNRINNSSK